MPSQSVHFIQIKKTLRWDKRIIAVHGEGLTITDFEGGETVAITFRNVISISYRFESLNDLSLTWYKQTKSGFKQTTWNLFSYDRGMFLSEYYHFYDKWHTASQPTILRGMLVHDRFLMEAVAVNVHTSSIEFVSEGPLVERFGESLIMTDKCIDTDPDIFRRIPFVEVGLIVQYEDGLELTHRSSHHVTTLLFDKNGADDLVQLILKKENQFLGFVNHIENRRPERVPKAKMMRLTTPWFDVDTTLPIFEQTRTEPWTSPTFVFQMFAWKQLQGSRTQRRVLLCFTETQLSEYDDEITEGCVELSLINQYPLLSVVHIVRTDFMGQGGSIRLIFKDRFQVSYTFEPFQRDIFITNLLHFIDSHSFTRLGPGNNLNKTLWVQQNDAFSAVPVTSTDPDLVRKVHGWPDKQVLPSYERYVLQQLCSSKDEWSFFENAISTRINVQLKDFQDNQITPLVCVAQMTERVFQSYIEQAEAYERYLRCHRLLRVLKSSTHLQVIEQLKQLKGTFARFIRSEATVNQLTNSYRQLCFENNPVWRALQISLVCSYTSFEDMSSEGEHYEHKRAEMIRVAETQLEDDDATAIQVTLLKMEEVLTLLIKLTEVPSLFQEMLHSRLHSALFSRIMVQVGQFGCTCPHPLISYLSNHLLSKLSRDDGFKSQLITDNFMTKLVHAVSTYTLVHEADTFQIKAANVSRQSTALTQTGLAYMWGRDFPRSFLREELYTLHILGYMRILEVFLSRHEGTKLVVQYLQTPYFIAAFNKLVHYKSQAVQMKATFILGMLLELLHQESIRPEIIAERRKAKPCAAILLFSRNFELLQTLLLKRTTIMLRLIYQLWHCTRLQAAINVWTISFMLKENAITCSVITRTFPLGLFNGEKNLEQWNFESWDQFFSRVETNYHEPKLVWGECERVLTSQSLQAYDYNFTYSQGIFLKQQQVDQILGTQEPNFLQQIELELFSTTWNVTQFRLHHPSLHDLWYVEPYYLRTLLQSEQNIRDIPKEQMPTLLNDMFNTNAESIGHHITLIKTFILVYKVHPDIPLASLQIASVMRHAMGYLHTVPNNYDAYQAVYSFAEAMHVIGSVYENTALPDKFTWEIYQNNIQCLFEHQAMDFIVEVFARSHYELQLSGGVQQVVEIPLQKTASVQDQYWSKLKVLLLDLLRMALLSCHTSKHIHLEPYPLVKRQLLCQDGGVRMHIILNQLLFDESQKIKQMIISIISQQLNDTQATIHLARIPIFAEALALQLQSKDPLLVQGVISIFRTIYTNFFSLAPEQVTNRLRNYLDIGMFIRKVPYQEEREAIKYLPYLRVIPFQLARKLIHMGDDKLQTSYADFDLYWNAEQLEDLQHYLITNISNYKKLILQPHSLAEYPMYEPKDGQQFRFIDSELQCGHIFLRFWSAKENINRASQVAPEVQHAFTQGVAQLLKNFLNTPQLPVVLRAYYQCTKLFKVYDDVLLQRIVAAITTPNLELGTLVFKLMTLYTLAHRQVDTRPIPGLVQWLQRFEENTVEKIQFMRYSLTSSSPSHPTAVESALTLLRQYCELLVHSASLVDREFTTTPEAKEKMFRMAKILGECILRQSQGHLEGMLYIITFSGNFINQDEDPHKRTMKKMIVNFTMALRNTLPQIQAALGQYIPPLLINTLSNPEPRTAVGRFMLLIGGSTGQWNEMHRKQLRITLLGGQQQRHPEGSYLAELNQDSPPSKNSNSNTFLLKIMDSMLREDDLALIGETLHTINILLTESPDLAGQLEPYYASLERTIEEYPNKHQEHEQFYEVLQQLIQLITQITRVIGARKGITRTLVNYARFAHRQHQFLLTDVIKYMNLAMDMTNPGIIQELVEWVVVLFEAILKIDELDLQTRQEAFVLFRTCFQLEFEFGSIRSEEQYEVVRLLKLLPSPMFDLLTSDKDEDTILENFYKEWTTPVMYWTTRMQQEVQLTILRYKPDEDYSKVCRLETPIHIELFNEAVAEQVILKEFNKEPQWPLPCPIPQLLLELSEGIDQLYAFEPNENKQYDRACCALVTYLSSFLLALNQCEDEQERDRIPEAIIRKLSHWSGALLRQELHSDIRSTILQIVYLLVDSELVLVLLKSSFIQTLFDLVKTGVVECTVSYPLAEKMLILATILKVTSKPFVRSNLTEGQMQVLMSAHKKDPEDRFLISIIHLILEDRSCSEEMVRCLQGIDPDQFIPQELPILWRYTEGQEGYFPLISRYAMESLPHRGKAQQQRVEDTDRMIRQYKMYALCNLTTRNLRDRSLRLQDYEFEGSALPYLRHGVPVEKPVLQQKYSMVSNDDIFS